jgi:hypothetical protein
MKLATDHPTLLKSTIDSSDSSAAFIVFQNHATMEQTSLNDSFILAHTRRAAFWKVPDFRNHCSELRKDQIPQHPCRRASMDNNICSTGLVNESTVHRPLCLRSGRFTTVTTTAGTRVPAASVTFHPQLTMVYVV